MSTSVPVKAAVLWCAILALAMANGIAREKVLVAALGPFAAQVASGIILSACILVVALAAAPWYGRLASAQWLGVGVMWLAMTLLFELGLGRVVLHKTWTELFEAYTFKGGNIWPLVLLVSLLAPWLAARLRGVLE